MVGEENQNNDDFNSRHSKIAESNRKNNRFNEKKLKKVNDSLEFEAIEDESQNEKS